MLAERNIPTRALVVEEPGSPFELRDITLDEVRADELLIEMQYTGLCHTVRDFPFFLKWVYLIRIN